MSKFPTKSVVYAIKDGASYRPVYQPLWRPGMDATCQTYGYWSAYRHDPDGKIESLHLNLSNCDSFKDVCRKVERWHPGSIIRNAHEAGDSYVD